MAASDLENTNWTLDSYRDNGAMRHLPAGAEVTLTFQNGAAGGKSGCNRYQSAVTVGDDSLVFGPALGTKMACPPPLMEIEDKYLRALDAVALWRTTDDTLELRDSAGQTTLTFARA